MYLMIRTFEARWNVEYLSGVTNEVVELVSVASIHLRKRAEIPEPPDIRENTVVVISSFCRFYVICIVMYFCKTAYDYQ
jgi:hypothetical protein